jgi:hypothetical protein
MWVSLVSYAVAEGAYMILPDIETGNRTLVLGIIGFSDSVTNGPSTLEVSLLPLLLLIKA